jgi:hypothetical protein
MDGAPLPSIRGGTGVTVSTLSPTMYVYPGSASRSGA